MQTLQLERGVLQSSRLEGALVILADALQKEASRAAAFEAEAETGAEAETERVAVEAVLEPHERTLPGRYVLVLRLIALLQALLSPWPDAPAVRSSVTCVLAVSRLMLCIGREAARGAGARARWSREDRPRSCLPRRCVSCSLLQLSLSLSLSRAWVVAPAEIRAAALRVVRLVAGLHDELAARAVPDLISLLQAGGGPTQVSLIRGNERCTR
jgi:hypothetical protein